MDSRTWNPARSEAPRIVLTCLAIIMVTAAVYWQIGSHEFISFDDNLYITENPHVQQGLTADGVRWAFSIQGTSYWHPLTWLSHMLDCELFGLKAGMHHLMNLFIHVMNSTLLFLVLAMMTGSYGKSAFVAVLFAVHPVNVESVAWAAERKNVLSTFFWIAAIGAYARYAKGPSVAGYVLVAFLFLLGLLAKPMLVTLPFVFLLLDHWPLKRFDLAALMDAPKHKKPLHTDGKNQAAVVLRLVLEKAPLIVISILSIVISSHSMEHGGFKVTAHEVSMALRVENAIVSYWMYLFKMICPSSLTFFYPYPHTVAFWKVIGSFGVLLAATLFACRFAVRAPYFIVGWMWFLGTLTPVLGIMQGGLWPAIAERWAYIPFMGLFLIIAWGTSDLLRDSLHKKQVQLVSAGFVILVLSTITWRQAGCWRDDFTLFSHALKVNPENYVAHVNLGGVYGERKNMKEAVRHFEEALRINPSDVNALNNLGQYYYKQGSYDRAVAYYSRSVLFDPRNAGTYLELGSAYACLGNLDKAQENFIRSIRLDPGNTRAHYNLGVTYSRKGEMEKAIQSLLSALRISQGDVDSHCALGVIFVNQGRLDDAIHHFRKALDAAPGSGAARRYLESALRLKEKRSAAGAVPIGKDIEGIHDPKTLYELAVSYSLRGENGKALKVLNRLRVIRPDDPDVYYNIACIHAKEGRTDEAIVFLQESISKGFSKWDLIKTDSDLANLRKTDSYKKLMKGLERIK